MIIVILHMFFILFLKVHSFFVASFSFILARATYVILQYMENNFKSLAIKFNCDQVSLNSWLVSIIHVIFLPGAKFYMRRQFLTKTSTISTNPQTDKQEQTTFWNL